MVIYAILVFMPVYLPHYPPHRVPTYSRLPSKMPVHRFCVSWTFAALLVCTLCLPRPAVAETTFHRLTILHTNDLAGRLYAEPRLQDTARGGLDQLAHRIRDTADGLIDSILVLDAGNAMGRSPACEVDSGKTLFELMGLAGYQALNVAGLELDYGLDTLRVRAGQAAFPMIGANIRTGRDRVTPFVPYLLVERSGLKIAVIGLLSSGVRYALSPAEPSWAVEPPDEVLDALLDGPAGRTDVQIVLASMRPAEVKELAAAFPEVDLFIRGGRTEPERTRPLEHAVRMVDGRFMVTTPGLGTHLGRLDIEFRREDGTTTVSRIRPSLIPIDNPAPLDQIVSPVVAAHRAVVDRAYGARIGRVRGRIEDADTWIADLARTLLRADVSIVERDAVRQYTLAGDISGWTLARLLRHDDALVGIEVTGKQLPFWVNALSSGRSLVQSGYSTISGRVQNQPLVPERTYIVAMTRFLADRALEQGISRPGDLRVDRTRIHIGSMLRGHVERLGTIDRLDAVRRGRRTMLAGRTKVTGSLSQVAINRSADQYRAVSFLGGRDALAWVVQFENDTAREGRLGTFSTRLRTGFGQLNDNGELRDAVDRIDGEVLYALSYSSLTPFTGLDINTAWTAEPGQSHPLTLRLKGGLQRRFAPNTVIRVAIAIEKDRTLADSVFGLEIAPEFRKTLQAGSFVSSQARVFWGASEGNKLSIQHFNSLSIRLLGNLAATLDAHVFLFRDSEIKKTAVKFELQAGLGYVLDYER